MEGVWPHGRQDTEATAQDQEAQAGVETTHEERVVARERKRPWAGSPGHRFRRRELALAEGGKLILHTDGSISQVTGEGATVTKWVATDPEWPRYAIRFGVLPQPSTTTPPDSRGKRSGSPGT
jgi:hypothetical protein